MVRLKTKKRGAGKGRKTKAPKPMDPMADKLMVRTVFGVSIMPGSTQVYVRLGDEYVRKPISDAYKDEEVLFSKEGIEGITLEQVSEALAKSDRYMATAPILFKRYQDGTSTTVFTNELFRGMAESPKEWPEGLDVTLTGTAPSLKEPLDLEAAVHIRESLLAAGASAVSMKHIRNKWLTGKVVCPRNVEEVVPALKPMAPGLDRLLQLSFQKAYTLYVVIRQCVMRSVSLILKGSVNGTADGDRGKRAEQGISTKPEIRIVAEHFASDINETHAAARILEIEPLKRGPKGHEEGILFRGIVTKSKDDLKLKTGPRVLAESEAIAPLITRIPHDFILYERAVGSLENTKLSNIDLFRLLIPEYQFALGFDDILQRRQERITARMERAGVKNIGLMSKGKNWARADVEEISSITRRFVQSIRDGTIDRRYGVPEGMVMSLFDHENRLMKARHPDVLYHIALDELRDLKLKEMKETKQLISTKAEEAEMARIGKKLDGMGFSRGWNYRSPHKAMTAFLYVVNAFHPTMLQTSVLEGRLSPLQCMGISNDEEKVIRWKKEDLIAIRILEEMGFGELVKIFPRADERMRPFWKIPGVTALQEG